MFKLESVRVNELKMLPEWREAPLGTILQLSRGDGSTTIGMRCAVKDANDHPCILPLDRTEDGHLLDHVLPSVAIDLSALAEVRISQPRLRPFSEDDRETSGLGMVSGTDVFVRTFQGGHRFFVWLTGRHPLGTVVTERPDPWLVIGVIEVAKPENPTGM